MSLKEAGLWWIATMVVIIVAYGIYENAKTVSYWRGRHDGWTMHRRMIDARDAQRDAKQCDPDSYYANNN